MFWLNLKYLRLYFDFELGRYIKKPDFVKNLCCVKIMFIVNLFFARLFLRIARIFYFGLIKVPTMYIKFGIIDHPQS